MSEVHESMAAYLQSRLIERMTGRSEDVILDNPPRNVLFAGCLIPRPDAIADGLESADDFYARLAPSAMQLRFLVSATDRIALGIRPHFHVYYRIIPPVEAQRRRTPTTDDGSLRAERLVRAYRKCIPPLGSNSVIVSVGNNPAHIALGGIANSAVKNAVVSDIDALRPRDDWTVPVDRVGSAEGLRAWSNTAATPPQPPKFAVDVEAEIRPWIDSRYSQVTVTLVNRSTQNEGYEQSGYWELAIFDAGFHVELETPNLVIEPYSFSALPNSYRFEREQWGAGINCVPRIATHHSAISTQSIASYTQPRLEHRTLAGVDLSFKGLVDNPIPSLERLSEMMSEYRETAWDEKAKQLAVYGSDHIFREEFARDLSDFDREIKEFAAGVALLKNSRYSILRQAFCLANEAFERVGRSTHWRLFQLVFLIRNLAVLASREWEEVPTNDDVEVLWFPTGGGKTEAFLGLITTALFFDRLRGRTGGVASLIRLPLRLLSHQQFQRVVKTVAAAETVRRRRAVPGRPFSVGYWIGLGGSPNTVDVETAKEWEANPAACQKWRKIRKCPHCDGEVRLRFNRALWSLAHYCSNDSCVARGDLPLYVVDDELYRFLPSVVVGTVDKLAAFGFQQRFGNLMGWPLSLCPKHGYSARGECLVPNCKEPTKPVTLKDPVPSLLVQDELHLLKEDLGAFDGHYETAIRGMQKEIPGGKPWKVIAATATIEQYDWQVYHLYCGIARRFPCPGPSWQDTFYSCTTAQTNRLFLGILPFNRSHINSMISTLWIYHHEIRVLRKLLSESPQKVVSLLRVSATASVPELAKALLDYEVSLTYVLTRKAGDQMAESLATQVAGYLRDENEPPLEIRSLTGQSSTLEVEQILDDIEVGGQREDLAKAPVDAVVATSMISHGVDVDRFNFIAFFGMPRLTAEYIQASSRVGRRFPGLALVVFSPARERDRSHFHLFDKYHQYLDRLVEPPAINRWARFAVKHTLPGIFVGSVINVLSRQLKKKLILERELYAALYTDRLTSVDDLTARVVRYYGAEGEHATELHAEVKQRIELFLNGLRRNAARTLWSQNDFRPMMSLRDVEEPVPFLASKYSADAFDLWMKRRRATAPRGETGIE